MDLSDIQLISYSDIRTNDNEINRREGIHFLINDYRSEGICRNPERSLARLSQYRFLLTPDYSTYADMNYWRQWKSVAHSRWVGAYWQDQGQVVVSTISWSTRESFEFCFGTPFPEMQGRIIDIDYLKSRKVVR